MAGGQDDAQRLLEQVDALEPHVLRRGAAGVLMRDREIDVAEPQRRQRQFRLQLGRAHLDVGMAARERRDRGREQRPLGARERGDVHVAGHLRGAAASSALAASNSARIASVRATSAARLGQAARGRRAGRAALRRPRARARRAAASRRGVNASARAGAAIVPRSRHLTEDAHAAHVESSAVAGRAGVIVSTAYAMRYKASLVLAVRGCHRWSGAAPPRARPRRHGGCSGAPRLRRSGPRSSTSAPATSRVLRLLVATLALGGDRGRARRAAAGARATCRRSRPSASPA